MCPEQVLPDSHHLDTQLLGPLQQASAILQGTAQLHAHLLPSAGRLRPHLQQQPLEKIILNQ